MSDSPAQTDDKKPDTEGQRETGPDIIRAFVKNLPSAPGVYRMIDNSGHVIYVGKARNLKSRVNNYTRYEGNVVRTRRMIAATAHMEFVRTKTEAEALLLEANIDRKSTRLNSSHTDISRMPSSA